MQSLKWDDPRCFEMGSLYISKFQEAFQITRMGGSEGPSGNCAQPLKRCYVMHTQKLNFHNSDFIVQSKRQHKAGLDIKDFSAEK